MQTKMLERLVFFSDAVFAISITLLVVEIGIPHIPAGASNLEAVQALATRLPKIIGFVVGFLVIGAFWAAHHRAFGMVDRHDPDLVWPSIHLLLMIAFLPFATGFMSENTDIAFPNVFYSGCMIVVALLQYRLFVIALKPENLRADVTLAQVTVVRRRSWSVPIAATIAIVGSFVVGGWAMLAFLLVPLLVRRLGRESHPA